MKIELQVFMICMTLIIVGGCLSENPTVKSTSYYISNEGNDEFPGTIEQPIKTIEKASNEAFTILFHRAYRAILFCSQPVIAAVGGPAIAGGFDLTMMCDIRYASTRAKFGQREIVLSLTPILDPLWRIIGLGRAKEVALWLVALHYGFVFDVGDFLPWVRSAAARFEA